MNFVDRCPKITDSLLDELSQSLKFVPSLESITLFFYGLYFQDFGSLNDLFRCSELTNATMYSLDYWLKTTPKLESLYLDFKK